MTFVREGEPLPHICVDFSYEIVLGKTIFVCEGCGTEVLIL